MGGLFEHKDFDKVFYENFKDLSSYSEHSQDYRFL